MRHCRRCHIADVDVDYAADAIDADTPLIYAMLTPCYAALTMLFMLIRWP